MDIFTVIGLGDAEVLKSTIEEKFPNAYYPLQEGKWLVAASGETAKSLSEKLGMAPGSNNLGIVITVGGYYGLAPADIWEWLKAKMSTVNA